MEKWGYQNGKRKQTPVHVHFLQAFHSQPFPRWILGASILAFHKSVVGSLGSYSTQFPDISTEYEARVRWTKCQCDQCSSHFENLWSGCFVPRYNFQFQPDRRPLDCRLPYTPHPTRTASHPPVVNARLTRCGFTQVDHSRDKKFLFNV